MKAKPKSKVSKARQASAQRVERHRARLGRGGKVRLEVAVPATDVTLLRNVAGCLRAGGAAAVAIRSALAPLLAGGRARTGAELLAFFRASPLVGVELHLERDPSPGRESAV